MDIFVNKEKQYHFRRIIPRIENSFLLRLIGINFTGTEFEPVYKPLIEFSKGAEIYIVFNAEYILMLFNKFPFVQLDRILTISLTKVEDV